MADIKLKYPATNADTSALTISLASLANDSTNKLAGRQSTVVDNTTNVDLDHLLGGKLRVGTTPTSGNTIELWAFAPWKGSSGTFSYPDTLSTTDAAVTLTSANVKNSALKLIATIVVDATTGRDYFLAPTSIAQLFGGQLPPKWGLFVINATGVALDATAGNFDLQYHRIQQQTV